MKEFLLKMIRAFFTIMAGILIATTVYCTIFVPDLTFGIDFLWQIIVMAFLTTLPAFIFYTKKELSKKQMLARQIIHACVLLALILSIAYFLGWIEPASIVQLAVFLALVACVYLVVRVLSFHHDKKIAERLNIGLKKYNRGE
jgi:uncharacterized membrane protein